MSHKCHIQQPRIVEGLDRVKENTARSEHLTGNSRASRDRPLSQERPSVQPAHSAVAIPHVPALLDVTLFFAMKPATGGLLVRASSILRTCWGSGPSHGHASETFCDPSYELTADSVLFTILSPDVATSTREKS
jgi:hypothetical protein